MLMTTEERTHAVITGVGCEYRVVLNETTTLYDVFALSGPASNLLTEALDYDRAIERVLYELRRDLPDTATNRPTPWPGGLVEAQCERCGGTFNPDGPDDLIHAVDDDGNECGGLGTITGAWE